MDIVKELKKSPVLLLSLPDDDAKYIALMHGVAKQMQEAYGLLLYVSPGKHVHEVAESLERAGLNPKKLMAVGTAKGGTKCSSKTKVKCLATETPILDLSMGIFRLVDETPPAAIIVEPLRGLAETNPEMEAVKLIHYLANDCRAHKRKLLLVCRKSCFKAPFIKDVELFVDKVVHP
jgi:hypothetical protein